MSSIPCDSKSFFLIKRDRDLWSEKRRKKSGTMDDIQVVQTSTAKMWVRIPISLPTYLQDSLEDDNTIHNICLLFHTNLSTKQSSSPIDILASLRYILTTIIMDLSQILKSSIVTNFHHHVIVYCKIILAKLERFINEPNTKICCR